MRRWRAGMGWSGGLSENKEPEVGLGLHSPCPALQCLQTWLSGNSCSLRNSIHCSQWMYIHCFLGNCPLSVGNHLLLSAQAFQGLPGLGSARGTGIRFADHFGEIPSCFLAKINQALGSSGLSDGQCVCVRWEGRESPRFTSMLISHFITHECWNSA